MCYLSFRLGRFELLAQRETVSHTFSVTREGAGEVIVDLGPVAYLCRPKCSFRRLFVRRRPGFSSPMLSAADADCKSH